MTRKRKIARRIGHRFSPGHLQHRVLAGSSPFPSAILFHAPLVSADQVLHTCRKDTLPLPP